MLPPLLGDPAGTPLTYAVIFLAIVPTADSLIFLGAIYDNFLALLETTKSYGKSKFLESLEPEETILSDGKF